MLMSCLVGMQLDTVGRTLAAQTISRFRAAQAPTLQPTAELPSSYLEVMALSLLRALCRDLPARRP